MTQVYHSNARTNQHQRKIIQHSTSTNIELAKRFNINIKTVAKHKKRDDTKDKSSRPNTIHYSLNDIQKEVIRVIRVLTWCPLDDLVDTIRSSFEKAKILLICLYRSSHKNVVLSGLHKQNSG